MFRCFISSILFLALLSCAKNNVEADLLKDSNPQPLTSSASVAEPKLDGYTRTKLNSEVTHVQPMTGIVLWNDNDHKKDSYVQLEFSYMLYSDICKKKGVFDWSAMDNLLKDVASRGHQAVVRFRYTYVGKKCAVPDYIKKLPGYKETKGKSEGKTTYFPDWHCKELRDFHMEFHRRFAERYDNDPRLAFVQTGFGLWAEYHIYDGPFELGKTFPDFDFQTEFLSAMDGWFVKTPWSISIDAADGKYAPFRKDKNLLNLKFGNFDDSFMCEDYDDENYQNWKFFGTERYKTAPLGGEFSYYSDYDQEHCLDKSGIHGRKFEDLVKRVHMSYIIGNDQPEYQKSSRLTEAGKAMGYRFKIKDYRIKSKKGAAILIANAGVAPIYRDAWVAVDGIRGGYNLRNLMPGEEVWIIIEDSKISSSVKPTIECDHLVPKQKGIEYDASVK